MGMKYVAAYLMAVVAGNEKPSAKDIDKILASVGIEVDSELSAKLVAEVGDKDVHEIIAEGREKLKNFGGGGGGGGGAAPAAAAAGGAAPAAAAAAPVVEEEEEEEMDFDLFG